MSDDLQPVLDALARAQQASDPAHALIGGTSHETIIRVMAQQTSATNAALLAWLEYVVARERRVTETGVHGNKPPPSRDERIHKTGSGKGEGK